MSRSSLLFALLCLAIEAHGQQPYALEGTVVTPAGVLSPGVVVVRNGRIESVGASVKSSTTPVIKVDGVIYPGLVDLHNHVTWNYQPRWKPAEPVRNRHDWQALAEYKAIDKTQRDMRVTLACDQQRYGEIKALIGGATAIAGSLGPSNTVAKFNECVNGLIRNLDFASGLYGTSVNREPLSYDVFPLELTPERSDDRREDLAGNRLKAMLVHLAEGIDAASRRELYILEQHGLLKPAVAVIHGVALDAADFATLAKNGVGLVWSPRSNIELYGKTADVAAAKAAGVELAISPDWSISGSDGMLAELRYANEWNRAQATPVFTSKELVEMATMTAAKLAAVSDKIGSIEPGKVADFLIVENASNVDAYDLLIDVAPPDVKLIIIGGRPVYGDPALVKQIAPTATTEALTVCGAPRVLDLTDLGKGVSLVTTASALEAEMTRRNQVMAPLFTCR